MALVVADRVWETTSTSGTGTLTLSGAVSGYQTFAAIGNGNTTYYTITNGTDWEVGIGTYTSSGTTLSRDTVLSSSSGGSKITVTPGSFVFCDYPASKTVYEDASDNVTGYSISGGTINNTTIGATTPSSVNATTITGQTATVNGTGQNLFRSTNNFSGWGVNSGTLTLSAVTTDPFGGTNVYKLVANNLESPTASSNAILSTSSTTLSSGATYTQSIYIKAAEFSAMNIRNNSSGEVYTFTIGSTPVATSGVLTPALTLISDGWYRASWSFVAGTIGSTGRSDNWSFRLASTGNGTSGIYVSSPQLEYGTILNSYIVNTTSTAIYGIPSISFAGVSSIALDNLGNLSLQPAGTGAIQAQATTSTTAGGNARGANAVDWQTARATAAQVASAQWSTISGGVSNTASATASNIGGGATNAVSNTFSGIFGGQNNTNTATYSFIGGGSSNTTGTNAYQNIVGGKSNTASGYFNFIGGGFTNAGTSASAVTTQSGTMNGTTAVTLSGSNASIKIGQYITGTSIAIDTYVSAISGTSLTLSQNASGSSTSTLSFFTPHGVVVGGGNNQATGSYSFIGGGGDAGTAANRNVASGDWSVVCGGTRNTASGIASFVGSGGTNGSNTYPNTSSGLGSSVVAGFQNTSSGFGAFIGGGYINTANSQFSAIMGGQSGITRGVVGNHVFPACNEPISSVQGVSQAALLILATQTTDATATALRSNTSAAGSTNQVILPNNSAYYFKGSCIANVTGAANGAAWSFEGAIMRGANAASTVLIDTPSVNRVAASAGATAWTIAITADTTNGGLRVTVTGVASTTIRWVAKVETTEVTF